MTIYRIFSEWDVPFPSYYYKNRDDAMKTIEAQDWSFTGAELDILFEEGMVSIDEVTVL